jgi:predicted histidine transporter YuiF (NhaC family)
VINGKNFYGLFKAPEVFEMICSSLINQPKECFSYNKNKNSQQTTNKGDDLWLTVLLIILLMLVGFLTALFVYTKLIKREVNQQMSIEVNKMV